MPESSRFDLVFSGRILPQFDLGQVKANLQRLFNANDAQLARMFSGEPVVLKSRLTEEDAEKYLLALKRQGAECDLRARTVTESGELPGQTSSPDNDTPAAAGEPSATRAEEVPSTIEPAAERSVIDDILAGINWDLAPVGSRMGPSSESAPAAILQTVSFDLAPTGSTIGEKKVESAPVLPDISHLSVSK
ncbi:hypothetical protein [Allohahella marinimesophila]|uniref:Uncharacterized protein n=1 Tax=Allohahella marinimesophila TaxID=1054972 RepID=A0ABP7P719_9GAMM